MKILRKVLLSLLLISIPMLIARENPINVFRVLFSSTFSDGNEFSITLLYFTPLLLTATAVQVALSAGLYNIGAEGQVYMGTCFAIASGLFFSRFQQSGPFGTFIYLVASFGFSFLGAALWGAISGALKAYRGFHEVISSILLNFIAYAFSNWIVLSVYKSQQTQASQTESIAETLQISAFWNQAPKSIFLAFVICIASMFFLKKSWGGFRIRATGYNPIASEYNGISTKKIFLTSMALSGGIAGLVGYHEVFFHSYKFIDGFSPGYGFTGLAIALAARGNTFGLVFFSFLFAILHKGALDMEIELTSISRDLSLLIQAIILMVLAHD